MIELILLRNMMLLKDGLSKKKLIKIKYWEVWKMLKNDQNDTKL